MITGLLIASFICCCVAVFSVPLGCWRTVRHNCRRLDGSFSARRCFREVAAFLDYLGTIAVPALLTFLFVFVAATLLFSWVMPLELVVRSFENFEWDAVVWRENLNDVRAEHAGFLRNAGFKAEHVRTIQQQLWQSWPPFAIVGVLVAGGALIAFLRCARHSVTLLVRGIRSRRKLYADSDVRKMMISDVETQRSMSSVGHLSGAP